MESLLELKGVFLKETFAKGTEDIKFAASVGFLAGAGAVLHMLHDSLSPRARERLFFQIVELDREIHERSLEIERELAERN